MPVRRKELSASCSNVTVIDGGKRGWKLPGDLDDARRRMAQDLLDMVEMKSGVTAGDVELAGLITRASMRVDQQRVLAEAALNEGDLKTYTEMIRLLSLTEQAVRRGIADLGLLPADRASKLSRTIAAKSPQGSGGKWGDL